MQSRIAVFIRYNLASILWSVFILILCGLPGSDFPDISIWEFVFFDKLVHVFLFLVLVFLSIKGLKKQYAFKSIRYNSIKTALIWAWFLSIITEVFQDYLFIERFADVHDVMANIAGSFFGLLVFYLVYGRENTFRYSSGY